MKIRSTALKTRTGLGRLGVVIIGSVALVAATQSLGVATQSTGASTAEKTSLRGVAQRLDALEYKVQQRTRRIKALEYKVAINQAKLDITEKGSLYGLLFNGDGPNGPDRQAWGDQIMTGNDAFLAYDHLNQLIPSQSFQHMSDQIAEAIRTQPAVWPNPAAANGSMHYMWAPVFDKITLTTAETRTPAASLSGVKGSSTPAGITIRVYHDKWKKTDAGWRKTTSTWYRLN